METRNALEIEIFFRRAAGEGRARDGRGKGMQGVGFQGEDEREISREKDTLREGRRDLREKRRESAKVSEGETD